MARYGPIIAQNVAYSFCEAFPNLIFYFPQRKILKNSNVKALFKHRVWSISSDLVVSIVGPNGLSSLHTRSLIIANGALERIIPFPGWTTPGVIGLAASTILLKSQFVLPGQSTVVAGCGPLLIAVANGIIKSGGKVSAIIDLNSKSLRFVVL